MLFDYEFSSFFKWINGFISRSLLHLPCVCVCVYIYIYIYIYICEERKERIPNFIISTEKISLVSTLHIGRIYIHTHRTHNTVKQ